MSLCSPGDGESGAWARLAFRNLSPSASIPLRCPYRKNARSTQERAKSATNGISRLESWISRSSILQRPPGNVATGCGNGRSPRGGPESRLWAAVAGRGQEPERPGQTKKIWPIMESGGLRSKKSSNTAEGHACRDSLFSPEPATGFQSRTLQYDRWLRGIRRRKATGSGQLRSRWCFAMGAVCEGARMTGCS
jgi:hypothetical protein